MEDYRRGSFTLPGEAGYEALTLKMAEKWGADVIRDSDGTKLSPEIIQAGYRVYSTICIIREHNAFAQEHPDAQQQTFLSSDPVTAVSDTLEIAPLEGYFDEQFQLNDTEEALRYWQVWDRTAGAQVPSENWAYSDGRIVVRHCAPFHRYTVSFLCWRIWEEINMYNHTTNHWQTDHLRQLDPRHPLAWAYLQEWLKNWCENNPDTNVVRLTSLFYNFVWIFGSDLRRRTRFVDWASYDFTVSPAALQAFEKEYGYALTAEDFIHQGLLQATHRPPTAHKRDYMDFIQRFVAEKAKKLVEIIHRYGKQAYVFYDDSKRIVMTDEGGYNAYVFDIKGNLLDSYSYIDDFCCEEPLSKYITVKKNGLYGLVDSCWNLVMPFKFKNELSAVDNNHFLTDLGDGIKGLVDLNGKILFKTPFDWVISYGNGIYSGNSYDSKDRKNKIVGFADIYGNTTLTKEEYATMLRWNKQREEEERIAAEKRKAQAENKSTTQQLNKSTTITFDGEEEVFVVVEEPPRFPGGDSALYMYLCMNLSYPDAARENKIEGMVVVLFVVEKDGSVSNVRVLRDIGGGCGEAAVEVVKNMPRWEPGRQAGKAIRTQFSLPLKFELKSYDSTNGMSQEEKCKFLLNQRGFIK